MTFENIRKIVNQGSMNYTNRGVEITCECIADACTITLYINKTLVEVVTVGHTDSALFLEMIKDTVEVLKAKSIV